MNSEQDVTTLVPAFIIAEMVLIDGVSVGELRLCSTLSVCKTGSINGDFNGLKAEHTLCDPRDIGDRFTDSLGFWR